MSHRVAGFTLIVAGLAGFVLEHLREANSGEFSFSFAPNIERSDLGLVAGDRYSIDTDAPVYLGQLVAVLDDQNNIVLTPYRDELLLLSTVVGLVVNS